MGRHGGSLHLWEQGGGGAELMSGGSISYQGNQQRGMPLTASLVRTITSWGLREAWRKAGNVHRVQVPRHWQGMHREQENSHLE